MPYAVMAARFAASAPPMTPQEAEAERARRMLLWVTLVAGKGNVSLRAQGLLWAAPPSKEFRRKLVTGEVRAWGARGAPDAEMRPIPPHTFATVEATGYPENHVAGGGVEYFNVWVAEAADPVTTPVQVLETVLAAPRKRTGRRPIVTPMVTVKVKEALAAGVDLGDMKVWPMRKLVRKFGYSRDTIGRVLKNLGVTRRRSREK